MFVISWHLNVTRFDSNLNGLSYVGNFYNELLTMLEEDSSDGSQQV
jgi:hypothetical protein